MFAKDSIIFQFHKGTINTSDRYPDNKPLHISIP